MVKLPVVAPVPPVTSVYGPPAVFDTCHWFEIPAFPDNPVAVKVTGCPQIAPVIVVLATAAAGAPEHAGNLTNLALGLFLLLAAFGA